MPGAVQAVLTGWGAEDRHCVCQMVLALLEKDWSRSALAGAERVGKGREEAGWAAGGSGRWRRHDTLTYFMGVPLAAMVKVE